MGESYSKPPLTFDQQVDRLASRGMAIPDRRRAMEVLARINYYRLSAYWHCFRQYPKDVFRPGSTFDQVMELYEYDQRLRLLAFDAIQRFEVRLRTTVTYELSHAASHGFAHGDSSNFTNRRRHSEWYGSLLKKTEVAATSETFLKHFSAKYVGFPEIPLWMASEVMSLGSLSKMYELLKQDLQQRIARPLGIHPRYAGNWFHSLTYVRNICAHHARLWNRELAISPKLPMHQPEWIGLDNRRVYAVLCVLRRLMRSDAGSDRWARDAVALLSELDEKPAMQRSMGVVSSWRSQEFWRSIAPPPPPSA